jgi:chromosome segregation ATPase
MNPTTINPKMSEDFNTGASYLHEPSSIKEPELLFPLSDDRTQHELDESCKICSGKFNVPGLSHTRKLFCHFCYRGTCSRCLGYEYYHGESKKIEPMCPECHAKLIAMSTNLQEELAKCRMERAEMRKRIILAQQEKKIYEKERQIQLEELNNTKKIIQDELDEKGGTLERLKDHHQELLIRMNNCQTRISDLNFQESNLKEHANSNKHHLEEIKQEKKKKKEKRQVIERELHEIQLKVSTFKSNLSEEQVNEEIERINSEISNLKQRKKEIKGRIKIEENRLDHIKNLISKNNHRIQEANDKLENIKHDEEGSLTEDEEQRINELKKQIKQLDEIVSQNQKKLENAKQKRKSDQGHYNANRSSHGSQSTASKSSNNHSSGDQPGCCTKCNLF